MNLPLLTLELFYLLNNSMRIPAFTILEQVSLELAYWATIEAHRTTLNGRGVHYA